MHTDKTQTLVYSNCKHLLNLLIRLPVKDSGAVFSSHLRSQIVVSFFANFKFGTDNKRPSRFVCFIFTIFFSRGCFDSLSANCKLTGRTASDLAITLSPAGCRGNLLFPSIIGLFISWLFLFLSSIVGLSRSGIEFSDNGCSVSTSTLSIGDNELADSLTLQ